MSWEQEDLRRIYNALLGIPAVYLTGFENNDLKQIYDVIAAGGTGMAVGAPVVGADPNRILFTDATSDLGTDSLFNFNSATKRMYLGQTVGDTGRINITGFGTTGATFSEQIKDSSGTIIRKYYDNGQFVLGGAGAPISTNLLSVYGGIAANGNIEATAGGNRIQNLYISMRNDGSRGIIEMRTLTDTLNMRNIVLVTDTGFGDNHASAILQVNSTTKGFAPPRLTTAQKNAISSPLAGILLYDTNLNKLCVYTGAAWETVTSV